MGGGSLINAAVALSGPTRAFGDAVWPAQIVQDGLLDEGYARAARWVRPARDTIAAKLSRFRTLRRTRGFT